MPNMQKNYCRALEKKEGLIDFNLEILFLSSYDTCLYEHIEINEI